MAVAFQPPPTYDLPIQLAGAQSSQNPNVSEVIRILAEARFNPKWLDWFIRLAQVLTAVGAGSGSIDHNLLSTLQGGTIDEYYHLTQALYTTLSGNQSANTYFAGPATGAAAPPAFRAGVVADITFTTGPRVLGRASGAGVGQEITYGTMLSQNANAVSITGGTIGPFTLGGTLTWNGQSATGTLANAGSITTIDINGGTIDGASIGATTQSTVKGTSLSTGASFVTPGVTTSIIYATAGNLSIIDAARTANNRIAEFSGDGSGAYLYRFINDAYNAATNIMRVTGGHAAGVTLIDFANAVSTVFGHTASITVGNAGRLQIAGTTDATSQAQINRYSADASGPAFALGKSRNASAGGNTIVQDNDVLGTIPFYGANGSTYTLAGTLSVEVAGTPGASSDMPGRMLCKVTPDGSGTPLEAWRATAVASAVNSLEFLNAVTTAPPQLKARGSDTDIDLYLVPKGAGVVQFGTHTGIGAETVTGFITVKDSGGTSRKLAVVS